MRLVEVEKPSGRLDLTIAGVDPIPPSIALAFSEVIHHLRGALDNAVFLLALTSTPTPLTGEQERAITFPVYDDRIKFNNWQIKIERLGLNSLGREVELGKRIASLQPAEDSSSAPSVSEPLATLARASGEVVDHAHPLALLQGYSNHDKHRALRLAAGRVAVSTTSSPTPPMSHWMKPFELGDILSSTTKGRLVVVDASAAVHIQRPTSEAWVAPAAELSHIYDHIVDVAIPVLVTGVAFEGSLPATLPLAKPSTIEQGIVEAGWIRARQRTTTVGLREAIARISAAPLVPPRRSDTPLDTHPKG